MDGENAKPGRPRSEQSRAAVLHAVDDLVVEQGYGEVTLKGIAERAGVSRQTIYRWWSTKAEILLEATAIDARKELEVAAEGDPVADLSAYLAALVAFLTRSPAGIGYRALVGEAQHDAAVAALLTGSDPLGESAAAVITRAVPAEELAIGLPRAGALLVGPVFFWILSGRDAGALDPTGLARDFLRVATASASGAARPRR